MLEESFYRPLGRTGVRVSPLGLGTDNFANPTTEEDAAQIIGLAIDSGINLIDTSDSYAGGESEKIIGRTLKASGRRDDVLLATKAFYPTGTGGINDQRTSRRHLISACENSLRRLQTDYIDLFQTHRVCEETALEETLGALTDLQRQGKIRYAGSTTSPSWKIVESSMLADYRGLIRMSAEQLPYNLLDRRVENESLPACARAGVAVFAWSPLAMGMLAGRYDNDDPQSFESARYQRGGIYAERITPRAVKAGQSFAALAAKFSLSPAQLALLWVKDQPGITAALVGPRTLAHLETAVSIMQMRLTEAMRDACDSITPPGSAIANFLNSATWSKQQLHW